MKRFVFITLAVTSIALSGCGGTSSNPEATADSLTVGDTAVQEAAEASKAEDITFEGGTTYSNQKYGYSIALPAGFMPQNNDAAMEEENGGKLFCCDRTSSIETSASVVADPADFIKNDYGAFTVDEAAGEKELDKVMADDHCLYKYHDSFGYRAEYYMIGKDKAVIHLHFCYESEQDFNDQVDKVIASLKVE